MTPIVLALILLLPLGSSTAVRAQERPIEITGFGDLWYVGGGDRFELGQVEIDLGLPLDERIDLEIAIALDEGAFTTGSFLVDFHLFGREGSHFRPLAGIDHSGLIVGQFDVPFGIDWLVYPSIDRKLVSGPVAVENTHDSWNDFGVQGYLKSGPVNAVVYAVNGFGYEAADAEVEMNLTVGGRVNVSPVPYLEVGSSYAAFFDQDYELDMALLGADLQFIHGRFVAKGEYLFQRLGLAGEEDATSAGFYAQGLYDFGSFFLVSRYGQFLPEEGEDLTRVSLGGGWVIGDGCEARVEQQINSQEEDLTLLQLVVAF